MNSCVYKYDPYDEASKNQVKKLTKAVLALFLVLVLTIGAIIGLVVVVVEGAKETKTSSSVRGRCHYSTTFVYV